MKRIPIPASAVYGVIKQNGPMTIEEIGLCSRSHTLRLLSELRFARKVYVSGWRQTAPGHYRMLIGIGSGPDVPMPHISKDEKMRRQRDYQRRRAGALRPKVLPAPPQLPTHHPRVGIWGL